MFGRRWRTSKTPLKKKRILLVKQVLRAPYFTIPASAQVFQRGPNTLHPIPPFYRATPKENGCRCEYLENPLKLVLENHSNAFCVDALFQMSKIVWTGRFTRKYSVYLPVQGSQTIASEQKKTTHSKSNNENNSTTSALLRNRDKKGQTRFVGVGTCDNIEEHHLAQQNRHQLREYMKLQPRHQQTQMPNGNVTHSPAQHSQEPRPSQRNTISNPKHSNA